MGLGAARGHCGGSAGTGAGRGPGPLLGPGGFGPVRDLLIVVGLFSAFGRQV